MSGLKLIRFVFILIFKLSLTVLAFYIISKKITINPLSYLNTHNAQFFILALLTVLPLLILQSQRWRRVLKMFNTRVSFKECLIAVWFGHLLNNLLPTASAGDLLRSYTLRYSHSDAHKKKVSLKWLGAFLSEKYIAATSALLLACVSLLTVVAASLPTEMIVLLLSLQVVLMVTPFLMLKIPFIAKRGKLPRLLNYIQEMSQLLARTYLDKNGRYAFIVSLFINAGMCLMFYLIAAGLNVPLTFSQSLFVVPVFTLLASLPISYAGWGIRELTCVGLLSYFGVSTESAVIVSVLYGLINLLSSVPGIIVAYPFFSTMYRLRKAISQPLPASMIS